MQCSMQCDHCDLTVNLMVRHSCESTVSMALAHTFTGFTQMSVSSYCEDRQEQQTDLAPI